MRKLNETKTVLQFGGVVTDYVGYHHGEASLHGTITKMANRLFNNINLLKGEG